jgi:hypothetical protein
MGALFSRQLLAPREERKKQIGFQLTHTLNDLAETRRKN